jgi:hypothetical protein
MKFGPLKALFWKIMLEIQPQICLGTHIFFQPLQNYRAEISATWNTPEHDIPGGGHRFSPEFSRLRGVAT